MMRVIFGSSSAVVATRTRRYSDPHKPRKHILTKLSPSSSSSSRIPTVHSSQAPRLSSVRWDLASRYGYYADMASKLAEDGRLEEFAMIVESVVASEGSALKFASMLNVVMVASGIVKSVIRGRTECVVEVLKKVDELGVAPLKLFDGSGFNFLKNECQRFLDSGEVEMFIGLMEILEGFRFPVKDMGDESRVVHLCVNKHDVNLAIRYACIVPRSDILFCTFIHEFGQKRDLVSALTVYEASRKHLRSASMYICRTIIDMCGLCGDYMKSRVIYEDLLDQNITLNIYVFNSLMNVNASDLKFTLEVYKNMQKLGVMADMSSYNILLKACCLAGSTDLAQEIYGEVKHLESKGVLKLDVFTYSTIVKVFADAKLWEMALKVKEDMISAGVTLNTITWSSLINACANVGLVEQAMHLFDEMLEAGCEPNSQCCNILLQACVEACQYDRAFRLFWSWKQSKTQESFGDNYDDNSNNISSVEHDERSVTNTPTILSSSCHSMDVKRFPFKPTTTTYNIMMKACCTDYRRVKSLMDEMSTEGLSPNIISWTILIDACGESGDIDGALQILKVMRQNGTSPDVVAYTTAIKVCVRSKKVRLAFSLFEEMKRYQIHPNLVTYNTLLRARSRYGTLHEVQQCLAVYQDMRRAGYKPNDTYLKELIEEWCEGVIQDKSHNQEEPTPSRRTNLHRPQSVLLETVAVHLQKNAAESLTIDLQGLTKVEARIVVLAVLRMTRENYLLGLPVKDDLVIILGPCKVDEIEAKKDSEVKDAVTNLLQDDLGLDVFLDGPLKELHKSGHIQKLLDSDSDGQETTGTEELHIELKSSTRRPMILQRLKVTKRSLYYWLRKKSGFH